MACNCKSEIEAKLLERFKSQSPDAKNHTAELTGYTFVIQGSGIVTKGQMGIDTAAEFPLKKSGALKHKKVRGGCMVFTFCPFCGKRYDEQPDADQKGTQQ